MWINKAAHFRNGHVVVLLWIKTVLGPVSFGRAVSVCTSLRCSGLLSCGWTFIIGEVKLHEGYLITELQRFLRAAFPGIHCRLWKVCKSNKQHIRRGAGG